MNSGIFHHTPAKSEFPVKNCLEEGDVPKAQIDLG